MDNFKHKDYYCTVMEGGTSFLFRRARVFSFGKFIPLSWWIPQKERFILAVASTLFWGSSVMQAMQKDPAGASILAFYGLGLFYVVCGMANLAGGVRGILTGYRRRRGNSEQARALLQLFGILGSMVLFNLIVLVIYVDKGATLTPLDKASLLIAMIVLAYLFGKHGLRGTFKHPFARGYLAIVCKALPQLLLAGLFILKPGVSHAFTLLSLGSLAVLASLRFWPSVLAYKRDSKNMHMQGLLLGECGNMISIVVMVGAWSYASYLS
jgi:hypothetical protein